MPSSNEQFDNAVAFGVQVVVNAACSLCGEPFKPMRVSAACIHFHQLLVQFRLALVSGRRLARYRVSL